MRMHAASRSSAGAHCTAREAIACCNTGLRRMSDDDEDREGSEDEAGSDMSDGEPGPAQRLTRQAVKAAAAQAQQVCTAALLSLSEAG